MPRLRTSLATVAIAIVSLLLLSAHVDGDDGANPDAYGHALWALGFHIGFAEVGSHENMPGDFLSQSLSQASEVARISGCLPRSMIGEIEALRSQMAGRRSTVGMHPSIVDLRTRMARAVLENCGGPGGAGGPSSPSGFRLVPNSALRGHNHQRLGGISLERCAAACLAHDGRNGDWLCRSFDYRAGSTCDLSRDDRSTDPDDWYETGSYDHYERIR